MLAITNPNLDKHMTKTRLIILFSTLMLLLVNCGESSYLEEFTDDSTWEVDEFEGVSSEIADGKLELTVDFPESLFWTTAGKRNFDNGTFEVEVTPLEGSPEAAYGLIFRASPNASDFYFFLVSADGFYSIGGCQQNCAENDFFRIAEAMWIESDQLAQGLNQTQTLRVEANEDSLAYFVDDVEIGRYTHPTLTKGDIGILLQTFDSSATVAYDNLSFTPFEETAAVEENDATE